MLMKSCSELLRLLRAVSSPNMDRVIELRTWRLGAA